MKVVILLFAFLSTSLMASTDCKKLSDDCEYYLCVAKQKHCDGSTYPVKFGNRYCMRYTEKIKNFSRDGKIWVGEVRRCLIKEMNGYNPNLTCSQLKDAAFASHLPCYLETGFCSLSVKDKAAIMETIWPTLENVQVWTSGMSVLKQCL
jgi:hypothetical protein